VVEGQVYTPEPVDGGEFELCTTGPTVSVSTVWVF